MTFCFDLLLDLGVVRGNLVEEDSVEMLEEEDVRWRRERFKSILGAGVIDVIGCGEARRSMSRKVNCMRLCSHKRHQLHLGCD